MRYYPIYLDLRGRPVVLLGGGRLAAGKSRDLLDAGAALTLIAPRLTNRSLREAAAAGRFVHLARDYRTGDLNGAFLAISTLDAPAINQPFWEEAEARGIPANVMDDVPRCSFIAAAIVRQGDLAITISTSGHAPALAVRLKERLQEMLGEEYARFLALAGTLRAPLAARFPAFEERRRRWYELVDSDVLELLRQGEEAQAHRRITEIMGVAPVGEPS